MRDSIGVSDVIDGEIGVEFNTEETMVDAEVTVADTNTPDIPVLI